MARFKPLIVLLSVIPLLSSCSLFQPNEKVIEYDEEVKLHDGSMIWVHIKRHYGRSNGREISNWFQDYEKGWGAKEVEISWDTGFPDVGRKTLQFSQNIDLIEKFNNKWYIGGFTPQCKSPCIKDNYIQLNPVGSLAVINNEGNFIKDASIKDLPKNTQGNLPITDYIKDWDEILQNINGSKLSWSKKLEIHQKNPKSLLQPIF